MFYEYLPEDPTPEEHKILNHVAVTIYQRFNDPRDKFIISMVFDLGYGKEETARALGCSYVTVYNRIKRIERVLSRSNTYKREVNVST